MGWACCEILNGSGINTQQSLSTMKPTHVNLEVFADLFNNVEDVAEIRKHDRSRINGDHI